MGVPDELARRLYEQNILDQLTRLRQEVDQLQHLYYKNRIPPTAAANDVQVGDGFGNWVTSPIATFEALLKTYLDTQYTVEVNAADIFRCDSPGGISAWTGTYVAAGSSGTTIKATTVTGQAGAMAVVNTNQLAKMRLYNTTRGNSVLISQCVAGAPNTITSVSAPTGWVNGDALTIASQTLTGGGFSWVDIELTSGPTGKRALFVKNVFQGQTAAHTMRTHPFQATYFPTYGDIVFCNVALTSLANFGLMTMTSNVVCLTWEGNPTVVIIREAGFLG